MERRQNTNRSQPYNTVRRRTHRYFSLDSSPPPLPSTSPIGIRTLKNVLRMTDDSELIFKLLSESNGFLLLLDQPNIGIDSMNIILAVVAKAVQITPSSDINQMLNIFYKSIIAKLGRGENFYNQLKLLIADLSSTIADSSPNSQKYIGAVQNLLILLRQLQSTVYNASYEVVRDLVQLITVQIEFLTHKGHVWNESIIGNLSRLNESIGKFAQMSIKTEQMEISLELADSYRKVSIYPVASDILTEKAPDLRANIIDGRYEGGVDHYLDVHFRLLREDFIRPLRDGVKEFLELKSGKYRKSTDRNRLKDLNVYRDVRIDALEIEKSTDRQIHRCKFDFRALRHIRWQNNKRLLPGSLVCLSSDAFQTMFFGIVAGRHNPLELSKGNVEIEFELEYTPVPRVDRFVRYDMLESSVYFEAYRHNLKVLQEFNDESFPLEKYIVAVDRNISPPSYLSAFHTYQIPNGLPESDPQAKTFTVEMLKSEQWPTHTDFGLDEAQFAAFKAALTKQLAIIQGPPGTGKTYIGLRIVQALLKNVASCDCPILIVCYTNHALDQFLEGIQKVCTHDQLIRIGGKSESATLDLCNFTNKRKEMKLKRLFSSSIHRRQIENNKQLDLLRREISGLERNVEQLANVVLGDELREIISAVNPNHLQQIERLGRGRLVQGIIDWLKFDQNMQTREYEYVNTPRFNERAPHFEQEIDEYELERIKRHRMIDTLSDDGDKTDERNARRQEAPRVIMYDFKRKLKNREKLSRFEAADTPNIKLFASNDRWSLYKLWIDLYQTEVETKIATLRDAYKDEIVKSNVIAHSKDIEVAKSAKIIAMTTTGAAKYRHIIDGVKPKITIVEEAAEVLEAHIVTSLCKETDHLILIGDHMQLQPNPAVYELAKKFNLDISLFERLINNEMEYFQLKQQYRMRPCISSLLVPQIYEELIDHTSVQQYEDVKGITKNMFFINHREAEEALEDTRSHMNLHEAAFIVELCRYVILQGYDASQVTILTTYSGQLMQIRKLMKDYELLQDVRATVVDNYQGEECDIILLSFVRSNGEGNIGFLKTPNRVNVALSRARKGLYCIGNFDCLASNSSLWQQLVKKLTEQKAIGDGLELYCQNHNEIINVMRAKHDFMKVRGGGCSLPCTSDMPCHHSCDMSCHIVDSGHIGIYKCTRACGLKCNQEQHCCRNQCHAGKECDPCVVVVEKLNPNCGHTNDIKCHVDPSTVPCDKPCKRVRGCGHKCESVCRKECDKVFCHRIVEAKAPCGHTVTIECSKSSNKSELLKKCTDPCNVDWTCPEGHCCQLKCHYANPCRCIVPAVKVRKECQHKIQMLCSDDPSTIYCQKPCERNRKCGHKCKDVCGASCENEKCQEIVDAKLSCGHSCKVKCSDDPNLSKCNETCGVQLKCGHRCNGTCSECQSGRLHISCKRKCGKTLICGHSCPDICSVECAPCTQKCSAKCIHGKCSLRCGEPCVPCKKKCGWRCRHLQCSKLCSEPCDRELCERPNYEILKCGHQSIGVCGEKTRRLCKKCDKKKVDQMSIGLVAPVRFIELQDCSHVIEVNQLLRRMNSEKLTGQLKIRFKECPKCKTPIRHTKALNPFIQDSLADIEMVKTKFCDWNSRLGFSLHSKVGEILKEKLFEVKTIRLRSFYDEIHRQTRFGLDGLTKLNQQQLVLLKNKFDVLETLRSTCLNFESRRKSHQNIDFELTRKFKFRLRAISAFIKGDDYKNCEQQRSDVQVEMSFIRLMEQVIVSTCGQPFSETGKTLLNEAFLHAHKHDRATEKVRNEFIARVAEACKHSSGFEMIFEEDHKMDLAAMNFQRGVWYKCPAGHIYCHENNNVAECPECESNMSQSSPSLERVDDMDGADYIPLSVGV